MPGIVRPGRQLIHEQLARTRQKKFDAKHPDHIELIHHAAGDADSFFYNVRSDGRGSRGYVQNAPHVIVAADAVVDESAIVIPGGNHGKLAIEVDNGFEHSFLTFQNVPCRGSLRDLRNSHLPFSVVSKARRLQNRGTTEFVKRSLQFRK